MRTLREILFKEKKEVEIPLVTEDITTSEIYEQWAGGKFMKGVYGEDADSRTPHWVKRQARLAQQTNQHVASAVTIFADLVIGGGIEFRFEDSSKDEKINQLMGFWDINRVAREWVESLVVTGDNYIVLQNNKKVENMPVGFETIYRPEDVYISSDIYNNPLDYILKVRVPAGLEGYPGMGYHWIKGEWQGTVGIHGIKFPGKKILHHKYGMGNYGKYGEGAYMSSADLIAIMREQERTIAVTTRYQSVPKKIFTIEPVEINGQALPVNQKQVDAFSNSVDQSPDHQQIFTNKKISPTSLYDAKDVKFDEIVGAMNWFSEKIISGIIPPYLLFGHDASYAVAKEQRAAFYYRINYMRSIVRVILKDLFTVLLPSQSRTLPADGYFEFTELSTRTPHENREEMLKLWDMGIITLNEARGSVDMDKDADGDKYKWELGGISEYGMETKSSPESEGGDARKRDKNGSESGDSE